MVFSSDWTWQLFGGNRALFFHLSNAGYVFYLAATGAYEIVELEKIEMTRQLDKVYRLDHAVTKTQKVILSAFDMDWNYVKYRAENISRILKGVQ